MNRYTSLHDVPTVPERPRSGSSGWSLQVFLVAVAMVALQQVVLIIAVDSSGLSEGGITFRVLAMLGFTTWFVVLWTERRGAKWVLVLPAIVPLISLGLWINVGVQPPPPQEALETAITEHCGLLRYNEVPPAGFVQFEDEIIIVVGTIRSEHVHRSGRQEYGQLRDSVLGGESLGAHRIACIKESCLTTCDPPRDCDDQHVKLFEIGSAAATDTAAIFNCLNWPRDRDEAPFFYQFSSSSSPEMERLVRRMYEFVEPAVLEEDKDEAMEDYVPEDE